MNVADCATRNWKIKNCWVHLLAGDVLDVRLLGMDDAARSHRNCNNSHIDQSKVVHVSFLLQAERLRG